MSNENKVATKDSLGRRSRAGMSTREVNLDKVYRKLKVALDRQADHLLRKSHEEILGHVEMTGLLGSLKLIKDLRKVEKDKDSEISDEELEKLAKLENMDIK